MSRWKLLRYRLERRALDLLAWGIPRLPRRACVRLADVLGDLAYRFDSRGRAVALANLECALGSGCPPEQRPAMARASYRNFIRTMLDLFWAQNLTHENFGRYLQLEGFDTLRELHPDHAGGYIFLTLHHANFEWASLACGFGGFASSVVAENFKNPLLSEVFNQLRQVSGQKVLPQENSMLRLLRVVKRGGATGMLLDLNLPPTQASTVIEGFGLNMCVTFLHAVLAQRAGTLLVPVETVPQPDGTCRAIAHPPLKCPPGATLQEITQLCWDFFEPIIRARPHAWLWSYKHFRYRPKGTTRAYPFYANESGKFEKLRRTLSAL